MELYAKKILKGKNGSNFYPADQGLSMMEKGSYVFHAETATAYPIIERTFGDKAKCELREVKLYDADMHVVLQKHSPFKDMMDTW